jgi:hypothetical protein
MGMTEQEYAAEEEWDRVRRELAEDAIEEFRRERLISFYNDKPGVAQHASIALDEARRLVEGGHPSAACVFAAIAIESCLKSALLRPIVHGLVHSSWAAELITEAALPADRSTPRDHFKPLLFEILAKHGGVDLREEPGATLWNQIAAVQTHRNHILHREKIASRQQAKEAIGVAEAVLEELFQSVILSLGFHLHDEARICRDNWRCKNRAQKGLWEDKRKPPPAWRIPQRA